MALSRMREKARAMRREGKSIGQIAKTLQISKSTVSYWCRDVQLSPRQIQQLAAQQKRGGSLGRLRAAEQKRLQRIINTRHATHQGMSDVGTLSKRDLFILGLALYWGEGYKNGNDECGITNSDPAIILTFISWLNRIYGIKKDDLILRISLNETHRHRVSVVERYWVQITRIPLSQFTKTSLIKMKVKKYYANSEKHFGTLRVKVRRGTSLRRRIMGSIHAVKRQIV